MAAATQEAASNVENWNLPAELWGDDFFLEEKKHYTRAHHHLHGYDCDESNITSTDTDESDEDDCAGLNMAGLAHRLGALSARTHKGSSLGCSPQSPLCSEVVWADLSPESSKGPSQVSSPPTPLEKQPSSAWDVLDAAARQMGCIGFGEETPQRKVLGGALPYPVVRKNPPPPLGPHGLYRAISDRRNMLQLTQLQQLKQQQLMRQKLTAAWPRPNQPRGAMGSSHPRVGFAGPTWPPPQHPHPSVGSGMRAVFVNGAGGRKQSKGTGVFLPRSAGSPSETSRKKPPSCSTFLVPAKVVHALNLNLEDVGAHRRFPGAFCIDHATVVGGRCHGSAVNPQKRAAAFRPRMAMNHQEIRLPSEWTY